MSDKLVSVIIPTYNGEKRIAHTLESLAAQTYSSIEIIVVDDVSTDDTVNTARTVLENSGRQFRIIRRTRNGRQSASRNTGLAAAKGDSLIDQCIARIRLDAAQLREGDVLLTQRIADASEQTAAFCGAAAVMQQHIGSAVFFDINARFELPVFSENELGRAAEIELVHN